MRSARSSLRFRLSLALGVLLVTLLGAELGYRSWLGWRWDGYSRERTEERLARMRDAVLGVRPGEELFRARARPTDDAPPWSVHPYLGFDLERAPAQIDAELAGLRADEGAFDILLVGGSVAADFGFWGRAALFEALARDPRLAQRKLRLFNYARPAHKQPQQLISVEYLLALGLVPDAVVSIDGFNEVAVANANAGRGVHPAYPADAQWLPLLSAASGDSRGFELAAAVFARREDLLASIAAAAGSPLLASALASRGLMAAVNRHQTRYAAAVDSYTRHLEGSAASPGWRGPTYARGEEQVAELCARVWSDASRSLAAVCAERGIACAFVLQPTLHDAGSKPATPRELEQGGADEAWVHGVRLGYPRLRAAGAELRAAGVPFHDASGLFREHPEELYIDACHFGEAGHQLLAEEVAQALLAGL